MAKPIKETPALYGKEEMDFIECMHKTENTPLTKAEKFTLKRVKSKAPYFDSMLKKPAK